jgi:carnitine monooxygenase subunit
MIVLHIIPLDTDRTLETYNFFLETQEPDELERKAIHYLDTVLQAEDIAGGERSAGDEDAGLHAGPNC